MRDSFVDALVGTAQTDERIVLITGDLGFGALDKFRDMFPSRFINAGVAEQNMISLAAGMSAAGLKPVIYSIANFPTFRAAEQLRNDVDYPGGDVTVVAVGGGVSYGALGFSHHALTDYSLFQNMQQFDIVSPASADEVARWTSWAILDSGPKYIRLDKSLVPIPTGRNSCYGHGDIWRGFRRGSGKKSSGCIVATGGVLHLALRLQQESPLLDIVTAPVWGPRREAELLRLSARYSSIVSVESHLTGGFGTWVAEGLRRHEWSGRLRTLAFSTEVIGAVGSREYLEAIATRTWWDASNRGQAGRGGGQPL